MRRFASNQLARIAMEKFGGAWLACILVMSRGDFAQAFSIEHIRIACVCGIVGAAVAVSLVAQMEGTYDSPIRQATISALVTFIGDVFSRISQLSPHWLEPLVTAVISASIAIAYWYLRRLLRGHFAVFQTNIPASAD